MNEKENLMLLSGGHFVHVAFADSIGAVKFQVPTRATKFQSPSVKALNLLSGAFSVPAGYKYIVCESCYFYPAIKRRLHLLSGSKIINLSGGPILYYILSGRVKGLEAKMLLDLLKDVEGHLVYGTFGQDILKKLKVEKPVRIIYPFIKPDLYGRLFALTPKPDSHRMCIVATSDAYNKGIDIMFKALETVAQVFPDIKLEIVTRMDPKEVQSMPAYDPKRVILSNNISDMAEVLARSSLYLQPSRSETFSVSALEALAAGVPSIVSDQTGVREVVDKLDKKFVIPVDEKALADSIIGFFTLPNSERLDLSNKSRALAKPFNEKNMLKNFHDQFECLKEEI